MEYSLLECIDMIRKLDLKKDIEKYASISDKDINIDEVEESLKDSLISLFENLVECNPNYIKLINQTGIFQNFYFWKRANDLYNDMKLYVGHNSVRKIDKVEYYLREIEEMLSSPTIDLEDAIFLKYLTRLDLEPEKRNQDFEALGRTLEWNSIEELISKMC